jgi:hypothetical protein
MEILIKDKMRIMAGILFIFLLVFSGNQIACADDSPPLPEITGQICNFDHHPIAGAQVRLLDESDNVLQTDQSGHTGSFEIKHSICKTVKLEIVPDTKSGLVSAFIDKIPGEVSRHFLVTLPSGFQVRGRVLGDGRGLKGLNLKVEATGRDRHQIWSGGWTKTGRDGSFDLTLTPGPKKLTISNAKYTKLLGKFEQDFSVTSDVVLPDISLPPVP